MSPKHMLISLGCICNCCYNTRQHHRKTRQKVRRIATITNAVSIVCFMQYVVSAGDKSGDHLDCRRSDTNDDTETDNGV